jgi:hypothetical protein
MEFVNCRFGLSARYPTTQERASKKIGSNWGSAAGCKFDSLSMWIGRVVGFGGCHGFDRSLPT